MRIIEVNDLQAAEVAPYARLTEAQLRGADGGLFIAESPKVIEVALQAGYEPVSMLCEPKHIRGDAARCLALCPDDMPLYTGSRELLQSLTGYKLTRGVLCAMRRRPLPSPADIAASARRIAVIDSVTDTTNIGAIFRSAAALGMDAVVLTPQSCDPLNRRSVRVSMGSVFLIPWTWGTPEQLQALGFKTVAMALRNDSVAIDSPLLAAEPRLAVILGTEGDGLSQRAIDRADYVAKIPMAHGVDSLNVAAASAIAFWTINR